MATHPDTTNSLVQHLLLGTPLRGNLCAGNIVLCDTCIRCGGCCLRPRSSIMPPVRHAGFAATNPTKLIQTSTRTRCCCSNSTIWTDRDAVSEIATQAYPSLLVTMVVLFLRCPRQSLFRLTAKHLGRRARRGLNIQDIANLRRSADEPARGFVWCGCVYPILVLCRGGFSPGGPTSNTRRFTQYGSSQGDMAAQSTREDNAILSVNVLRGKVDPLKW